MKPSKWPKYFPPLTEEQTAIRNDFVKYWLSTISEKYGIVERFNHGYSIAHQARDFKRTLEIGAGIGKHIDHERLTPEQEKQYTALELRHELTEIIRTRHPRVQAITGDIQERLPFPDGHFDRILAIHVLEHLPNAPAAIEEIHRLCDPHTGQLSVVLPCEGGLAYGLARRVSARRLFEKRYGQPYQWFIEREHLSGPRELLDLLCRRFEICQSRYFPLRVPYFSVNLCAAFTLKPRPSLTVV